MLWLFDLGAMAILSAYIWLIDGDLRFFWSVLTILIIAGRLFYISVVYFLRVSRYSGFRGQMSVGDCVWFPKGLGKITEESRYFLISAVCHELFVTLSIAPKRWEMGLYWVSVMYYYETMMSCAQAIGGIMLQSVWRVWQKVVLLPSISAEVEVGMGFQAFYSHAKWCSKIMILAYKVKYEHSCFSCTFSMLFLERL